MNKRCERCKWYMYCIKIGVPRFSKCPAYTKEKESKRAIKAAKEVCPICGEVLKLEVAFHLGDDTGRVKQYARCTKCLTQIAIFYKAKSIKIY